MQVIEKLLATVSVHAHYCDELVVTIHQTHTILVDA